MNIEITKRDYEIYCGYEELKAIANSDIESAFSVTPDPRIPSLRTSELYADIIEAVEIHTRSQEE